MVLNDVLGKLSPSFSSLLTCSMLSMLSMGLVLLLMGGGGLAIIESMLGCVVVLIFRELKMKYFWEYSCHTI